MTQQINLCTPLFLTPKRYFSAATMVQALGVFLLVGGLLAAYWTWSLQRLSDGYQQRLQVNQKEVARLQEALRLSRAQSAPADAALVQELERAREQLKQREQLLGAMQQGLLREGYGHAARLDLVAQTIPPQVWVTGMRADMARLELSGYTLEPAALNVWMARLAKSPLLEGQQIATVKVERVQVGGPGAGSGAKPVPTGGAPAWAFTLVSEVPPAPPGAKP